MASIRNLKKDINYVMGDIIEAVYIHEMTTTGKPTDSSNALIDEAITTFDALIAKVNDKTAEDRRAHLKQVEKDLEAAAIQLVEKVNAL
ncbi:MULTISPECIES: hypothetical protein [Flavobacterium]|uniref:Uncharacterized protein n=1 Tax=Flavobacterium orientale TaxID=1756020 RepID=A0A916XVA9_9FLAO|nr:MULTISPECIES: hypothetical protein [Flavobacterium]GGD15314.1 hypothetical protein GCM10011343_02840 [Flavobacterium orientale]